MRIDVAIAFVVGVVVLSTAAGMPHAGSLDPTALLFAALACAVLALRRRWPFHVLVVSSLAAETYLALAHTSANGALILAAPLIALYTVAESASRRPALTIGVTAVLVFAGLHMLAKPSSWLGMENLALAALGGLAVAAGDGARSRREYLAEVEGRARRAELDREADARRRVTDERLRIARDLHDAVGHQLALINVQAGVAAHLLDSAPADAREALRHVRAASRTALGELRDTIGLLRQPGDQTAPVEPVPGLSDLPELLDTFRRSGLTVEVTVWVAEHGDPLDVPAPVDLTAYRVIQEALTNVCKHAGTVVVHLAMRYTSDTLEFRVDNEPPVRHTATETAAGPALGLVGMRERVEALGGSLHAGPRPDGGYRITAILPRVGAR